MIKRKVLGLLIAGSVSTALFAEQSEQFPSERNAMAIADAIHDGVDLHENDLAKVLTEGELDQLVLLRGCSASLAEPITINLALHHWECDTQVDTAEKTHLFRRTTTMRFQDNGALFAMAVNPSKSSFGPTEVALALSNVPSREETAREFAQAAVAGSDPTLGGLIPLEPYQVEQLQQMHGGDFEIIEPMSHRAKQQARKRLGPKVRFYERPDDGIELTLMPAENSGGQNKNATIFFNELDHPIGVHLEKSLLKTSSI